MLPFYLDNKGWTDGMRALLLVAASGDYSNIIKTYSQNRGHTAWCLVKLSGFRHRNL